MVRKGPLIVILLVGLAAVPRPASAGCASALYDCYAQAARIDSFWYRTAAGLGCEFDYADCVRAALLGA